MAIALRPARPDDLAGIVDLHNRSEHHDGIARLLVLEELAEDIDDERVVFATDTRVAEREGELAGYAYTYHLPSDAGLERCYIFGQVDPAHRGEGIGRALLAWGIDRATDQLRGSGTEFPKFVRVDSYDFVTSAQRLFARLGFTPVRWFEELLRPLTDLPDLPDPAELGRVVIEPWPHDRDEELRRVRNAAFADHWGSTPVSEADWEQKVHGFGARPDLSFAAIETSSGIAVGMCINRRYESDDELLGRRDGWIDNIGTLAQWRGKGVASALLVASLHAFAAAGLTHASLGVDMANPTGAHRLYRKLGFEPLQQSITSELRVG